LNRDIAKLMQSSRFRTASYLLNRALIEKVSQPKYDLSRFFDHWRFSGYSKKHI